jgi:hypothetical protein
LKLYRNRKSAAIESVTGLPKKFQAVALLTPGTTQSIVVFETKNWEYAMGPIPWSVTQANPSYKLAGLLPKGFSAVVWNTNGGRVYVAIGGKDSRNDLPNGIGPGMAYAALRESGGFEINLQSGSKAEGFYAIQAATKEDRADKKRRPPRKRK